MLGGTFGLKEDAVEEAPCFHKNWKMISIMRRKEIINFFWQIFFKVHFFQANTTTLCFAYLKNNFSFHIFFLGKLWNSCLMSNIYNWIKISVFFQKFWFSAIKSLDFIAEFQKHVGNVCYLLIVKLTLQILTSH